MFKGLVINEFIKLIFKKKLLISFLILVCFQLYFFGTYWFNQEQNSSSHRSLEEQKAEVLKNMNDTKQRIEDPSNPKELVDALKNDVKIQSLELKKIEAMESGDWVSVVKAETTFLKNDIKKDKNDVSYSMVEQLYKNQYSLEHQVPPAWFKNQSLTARIGGMESIPTFFGTIAPLILPLLLIFIFSDLVAGELSDGTAKLIYSRPPSRLKVLWAKYVVMITSIIGIVLLINLVSFVAGGLLFGFGGL